MCEPLTMAAIASTGVGMVMGANAAVQRGRADKAIAYDNAQKAMDAAADAVARGRFQQQMTAIRGGQVGGQQREAVAAGGVANEGSAQAVESSQRLLTSLDEEIIRTNAAREAMGLTSRASLFRAEGDRAEQAGKMNAIGTIIGGIGKVAGIGTSSVLDAARAAKIKADAAKKIRLRNLSPVPMDEAASVSVDEGGA